MPQFNSAKGLCSKFSLASLIDYNLSDLIITALFSMNVLCTVCETLFEAALRLLTDDQALEKLDGAFWSLEKWKELALSSPCHLCVLLHSRGKSSIAQHERISRSLDRKADLSWNMSKRLTFQGRPLIGLKIQSKKDGLVGNVLAFADIALDTGNRLILRISIFRML